jgi:hypothetical protein
VIVYTVDRKRFLRIVGAGAASAAILSCMPSSSEKPKQLSESEKLKQEHHYKAKVGDKEIELPTKPFIYLPFKKHYPVAQGWLAIPEETKKSGVTAHWALDFKTPYDTELVSPVKGLLVASIQASWRTKDVTREGKTVEEKVTVDGQPIGYGGGIVVEIITPTGQRIQILHMASLDRKLGVKAFSKPSPDKDGQWAPTGITRSQEELEKLGLGVMVEVGQPIGTAGFSGLGLGEVGIIYNGEDWPTDIPETAFKTWDDIGAHPHLAAHFRNERGGKYGVRDVAAKYSRELSDYNDSQGRLKLAPDALVHADRNGVPLLAA